MDTRESAAASTQPQNNNKQQSAASQPLDIQALIKEVTDTRELGARGEGLLAAQVLLIALVFLPIPQLQVLFDAAGAAALLASTALILWSFQSLGNNLTPFPAPRKEGQLVTTGAYGYARHPLYGGLILGGIGLGAVMHDDLRLLLAGVLWIVLEIKAKTEEGYLEKKFADYDGYRKTVKKFIPFLY